MKVAIIGLAETWRAAPWGDPTWAFWGCNGSHLQAEMFRRADGTFHADAWMQIHPVEGCDASELDWLQCLNDGLVDVPTYVRPASLADWTARYPQAAARGRLLPYPAELLTGLGQAGWLANTFCLQILLALHLGASEIGLYGVECAMYGRELAVERPALAYWMGIAAARGTQLHCPSNGTLWPFPEIYGVDYWAEARVAAAIGEVVCPPRMGYRSVNLDTVAQVDAAEEKVHARQVR